MTEQVRREMAINFLNSHQVEMRGIGIEGQRPEVIEVKEVFTEWSGLKGEIETWFEWATVELSLQPLREWMRY